MKKVSLHRGPINMLHEILLLMNNIKIYDCKNFEILKYRYNESKLRIVCLQKMSNNINIILQQSM